MRALGACAFCIQLVAVGSELTLKGLHFPELHGQKDYPYDEVLSNVTSYCYRRLVHDADCCLDERFAPDVTRHVIHRPGAEWICGNKTCYDGVTGPRGYDAVWIPKGATCDSPRVLYIHGGSWMYGSPDTYGYGQLASKLAAKSGAVVMVPDYPLVPIANFSVIMEAAKKALSWLALHGPFPGCVGRPPLLVGGDSSGGGTALSLILEVKKHPESFQIFPDDLTGRIIAGGFFFSPWTNLVCDTPDYYHHAFSEIVDREIFKEHKRNRPTKGTVYVGDIIFHGHPNANEGGFQLNSQAYVGDYRLLMDPVASPMYAGAAELAGGGVPPLYFAVGASESILGDSVIVAQKAADYGAEVSLEIFEGMWHVFPMYSEGCGGGEELWEAKRALERTAAFVRRTAATQGALAVVPDGWAASLAVTSGSSVPNAPFTVLNYELEEGLLPQAAAPTSLADRRAVGSSRWPQDSAHAATFLLGAGSVLAVQALAHRLMGKRKEFADNSIAAPFLP
mmetsp:Transcript_33957/g.97653  ORF Transcript_33957/g.97653 Transcript_33957/m.97653 type:complete len:507 (+) Transcript_33957:49-1569(+)